MVHRFWLLVLVLGAGCCHAFSLGRLFPASRGGRKGLVGGGFKVWGPGDPPTNTPATSAKVQHSSDRPSDSSFALMLQRISQEAAKKPTQPTRKASTGKPGTDKPKTDNTGIDKLGTDKVTLDKVSINKPSSDEVSTEISSVEVTTESSVGQVGTEVSTKSSYPMKLPYPVTNSPIYYIKLPPVPYVYMPGLGYVSPNVNGPDAYSNFIRPPVPFINNGKPTNIYTFKETTTTTTTTTTTPAPTTSRPQHPALTPSPITWLKGPWVFNGRPSNLFMFPSPHDPGHFDRLHKTFSKPGVYLK